MEIVTCVVCTPPHNVSPNLQLLATKHILHIRTRGKFIVSNCLLQTINLGNSAVNHYHYKVCNLLIIGHSMWPVNSVQIS